MNYPNFFNSFEDAVKGEDLYLISEQVDLAAKLIEQSILSSSEYDGVFYFNEAISNDESIQNEIEALDLETEMGINRLKEIIDENAANINASPLIVFYFGAVAISIAAVLYSVYYKVAYWGPKVEKGNNKLYEIGSPSVERDEFILEISEFF